MELEEARRRSLGGTFLGLGHQILLPAPQNPLPLPSHMPSPHKQQVLPLKVFSPCPLKFSLCQDHELLVSNLYNYMGNCEPRWFLLVSPLQHVNLRYILHLAKSSDLCFIFYLAHLILRPLSINHSNNYNQAPAVEVGGAQGPHMAPERDGGDPMCRSWKTVNA